MQLKWPAVLLVTCSTICLMPAAFSQSGGPGWLSGWTDQLGIKLEKTPSPVEEFSELSARVDSPEKLGTFLPGVTADSELLITHAGNVAWTTPTPSGTVRPCVIKVVVKGTDKSVTLVPDRRTLLLRLAPPPFRGSNLK